MHKGEKRKDLIGLIPPHLPLYDWPIISPQFREFAKLQAGRLLSVLGPQSSAQEAQGSKFPERLLTLDTPR